MLEIYCSYDHIIKNEAVQKQNEKHEGLIVSCTNAVSYPWAVMIKILYTNIADLAMRNIRTSVYVAGATKPDLVFNSFDELEVKVILILFSKSN